VRGPQLHSHLISQLLRKRFVPLTIIMGILRMLANCRVMIACRLRKLTLLFDAYTVTSVALVVVSRIYHMLTAQPVFTVVVTTPVMPPSVKGTQRMRILGGPLVAGDVNLIQGHVISVLMQGSTGTLLRENTSSRTKVSLLCVDFSGAQSISYLRCHMFNTFYNYIIIKKAQSLHFCIFVQIQHLRILISCVDHGGPPSLEETTRFPARHRVLDTKAGVDSPMMIERTTLLPPPAHAPSTVAEPTSQSLCRVTLQSAHQEFYCSIPNLTTWWIHVMNCREFSFLGVWVRTNDAQRAHSRPPVLPPGVTYHQFAAPEQHPREPYSSSIVVE
jgi:hypothetical protein